MSVKYKSGGLTLEILSGQVTVTDINCGCSSLRILSRKANNIHEAPSNQLILLVLPTDNMASKAEEASTQALVTRFLDALENIDASTALDCLAPDVKIWHNVDEKIKDREKTREVLVGANKRLKDVKYSDRRLNTFPGGFVEQHTIEATRLHDGGAAKAFTCMVCKVEKGEDGKLRIAKMEQYFDSAHQASFYAGYG
jgi:ketosteroid isomerase-like protein